MFDYTLAESNFIRFVAQQPNCQDSSCSRFWTQLVAITDQNPDSHHPTTREEFIALGHASIKHIQRCWISIAAKANQEFQQYIYGLDGKDSALKTPWLRDIAEERLSVLTEYLQGAPVRPILAKWREPNWGGMPGHVYRKGFTPKSPEIVCFIKLDEEHYAAARGSIDHVRTNGIDQAEMAKTNHTKASDATDDVVIDQPQFPYICCYVDRRDNHHKCMLHYAADSYKILSADDASFFKENLDYFEQWLYWSGADTNEARRLRIALEDSDEV